MEVMDTNVSITIPFDPNYPRMPIESEKEAYELWLIRASQIYNSLLTRDYLKQCQEESKDLSNSGNYQKLVSDKFKSAYRMLDTCEKINQQNALGRDDEIRNLRAQLCDLELEYEISRLQIAGREVTQDDGQKILYIDAKFPSIKDLKKNSDYFYLSRSSIHDYDESTDDGSSSEDDDQSIDLGSEDTDDEPENQSFTYVKSVKRKQRQSPDSNSKNKKLRRSSPKPSFKDYPISKKTDDIEDSDSDSDSVTDSDN